MNLNRVTLLVGGAGFGKSTVVRELALAHLRAHPRALALVHDPHSGMRDFCQTYESAAAVRAAYEASTKPGGPVFHRGSSIRGSSTEVRDLAVEVGARANTMDKVTVPILYGCEETTLMDSSSKTYAERGDLAMLGNRRHLGIHIVMGVQTVEGLTEAWYGQATEVLIFSLVSTAKALELEKRIGLEKGELAPMVRAGKFRYLLWRLGEGLV